MDQLVPLNDYHEICISNSNMSGHGPHRKRKINHAISIWNHVNKCPQLNPHRIHWRSQHWIAWSQQTCLVNQREVSRHTKSFKVVFTCGLAVRSGCGVDWRNARHWKLLKRSLKPAETVGHLVLNTPHHDRSQMVDRQAITHVPGRTPISNPFNALKPTFVPLRCCANHPWKGLGGFLRMKFFWPALPFQALFVKGKHFKFPSTMRSLVRGKKCAIEMSAVWLVKTNWIRCLKRISNQLEKMI